MTQEEMALRLMCLEKSIKKANFRIYLLEKKKELQKEAKRFFEAKEAAPPMIQLDIFEAVV